MCIFCCKFDCLIRLILMCLIVPADIFLKSMYSTFAQFNSPRAYWRCFDDPCSGQIVLEINPDVYIFCNFDCLVRWILFKSMYFIFARLSFPRASSRCFELARGSNSST